MHNLRDADGSISPYTCPNCGDVWRVSVVEHIDTERDDVYSDLVCDACYQSVREARDDQGRPCYTEIDDDECYFDEEYQTWLAGEIDDDGFATCDDDDWDERDPYYGVGESCDLPGCIALPGHFRDECHTARDAALYHAEQADEPVPLRLREPFYSMGLVRRRIRYRDEVACREWHHHLHVEILPRLRPDWLRRLWPERCLDCGRRFGKHETCLPV